MPSVIFTVKEMARVAYSQNANVKLVDETTNDDAWGPTCQQMDEVCRVYAYGGENSEDILREIVTRLENRKEGWRRCYKSLLLLDHMARTLPDRYVRDLDRVIPLVSTIARTFNHTDSKGVDQGVNIRERAKKLVALLQDRELLAAERAKSAATASKVGGLGGGDFGGVGRNSSGFGSGGPSSRGGGASSGARGDIANRQNTYGVGVSEGGYDAYVPQRRLSGHGNGNYHGARQHTAFGGGRSSGPSAASLEGPATCHPSGRPFTKEEQEQADMAFAARLQQEEERASGTRVTDTDIGRRMANEGRAEQEARELAAFNKRQAEIMARRGAGAAVGATAPRLAPSGAPAGSLDAEARMALELQARLDRGEDMESAIAAITAKYQPQQQQQAAPVAAMPPAPAPAPQRQQQSVIDPFAPSAVQQQPTPAAAPSADLDFFADIPQGSLSGQRPAPAKPAGGVDDFFATAPSAPQANASANAGGGMDFFGAPTPARPAQQQQQQANGGLDFFGNTSPNTFNGGASANRPPATADDFFGTAPAPAQQQQTSSASAAADPFSALTQAQQTSLDALSGQQKRQPQLGQANNGARAPVW